MFYINHYQGAPSLCSAKVTMLTSVTYRYLWLTVLWLHILFNPVMSADRALCKLKLNMQSADLTLCSLTTLIDVEPHR
jgi:hypothetical protein